MLGIGLLPLPPAGFIHDVRCAFVAKVPAKHLWHESCYHFPVGDGVDHLEGVVPRHSWLLSALLALDIVFAPLFPSGVLLVLFPSGMFLLAMGNTLSYRSPRPGDDLLFQLSTESDQTSPRTHPGSSSSITSLYSTISVVHSGRRPHNRIVLIGLFVKHHAACIQPIIVPTSRKWLHLHVQEVVH